MPRIVDISSELGISYETVCRSYQEVPELVLTKALAIREKHLNPNDRLIASTLSVLWEARAGLGRHDQAGVAYDRMNLG